jgi:hypothetical protein
MFHPHGMQRPNLINPMHHQQNPRMHQRKSSRFCDSLKYCLPFIEHRPSGGPRPLMNQPPLPMRNLVEVRQDLFLCFR